MIREKKKLRKITPQEALRNTKTRAKLAKIISESYVVYGMVDPRTKQIRYIGKATDGLSRACSHMTEFRRLYAHNERMLFWYLDMSLDGVEPEFVILEHSDWQNLHYAETNWIKLAAEKKWLLCNEMTFLAHAPEMRDMLYPEEVRILKMYNLKRG